MWLSAEFTFYHTPEINPGKCECRHQRYGSGGNLPVQTEYAAYLTK